MWVMSRYGFYSAVAAKTDKGKCDPRRVVVRARTKEHLVNLCKRFKKELHGITIQETERTDYPCRMVLSKTKWTGIVTQLSMEIDYNNFKDECHHALPDDLDYHHALMRVWTVMRNMQTDFENWMRNTETERNIQAGKTGTVFHTKGY